MDFLHGNIRTMYVRCLSAAFGSALVTSIYSMVDMAVVGQYQGPTGTAALAVVAPIWNIIYSLGLLMGIGGSVLFSTLRGRGATSKEANQVFTVSIIGTILLSGIVWIIMLCLDAELLQFFGADQELLAYAQNYLRPIQWVIPCFLFVQMLAAVLRNDGNPGLATLGVLTGGLFNVFGDVLFVFGLDMGIYGAGLATAMGSVISCLVLLTHFRSKRNTLSLVLPQKFLSTFRRICITGFSTFFVDVAMGILTILFNRQIMKYLGADALSVYGIIVNVSTFVQCCAYSAGQAAQPILSMNYGAGKIDRIKETLRCSCWTVVFFSVFWTILVLWVPNVFVHLFMKPTASIVRIAPAILRWYGLSFLGLPFNVFSTYFFQAVSQPKISMVLSVLRGLVLSGAWILALPWIFPQALWLAMPLTEAMVFLIAVWSMIHLFQTHLSTDRSI